ncbi:hypothetical protein ACVW0P_000677 [Mucilaginibacter sp. UYNi724]
MARPLKSDAERRDFTFRVRANSFERERIEQNANDAGQEPSVYLRSLGTGTKPTRTVPTQDREALLKVLAALNKVGSNHNQIARSLNRRQDSEDLSGISFSSLNLAFDNIIDLTAQLMDILK